MVDKNKFFKIQNQIQNFNNGLNESLLNDNDSDNELSVDNNVKLSIADTNKFNDNLNNQLKQEQYLINEKQSHDQHSNTISHKHYPQLSSSTANGELVLMTPTYRKLKFKRQQHFPNAHSKQPKYKFTKLKSIQFKSTLPPPPPITTVVSYEKSFSSNDHLETVGENGSVSSNQQAALPQQYKPILDIYGPSVFYINRIKSDKKLNNSNAVAVIDKSLPMDGHRSNGNDHQTPPKSLKKKNRRKKIKFAHSGKQKKVNIEKSLKNQTLFDTIEFVDDHHYHPHNDQDQEIRDPRPNVLYLVDQINSDDFDILRNGMIFKNQVLLYYLFHFII